jgi:uncharacterized protein
MSAVSPSITSYLAGLSTARLRALFSQEPERAADWVRVIAMEGLAQAQVCYGRMLLEGTGGRKDLPAALAWFRRAAARGDMDAVNMVGRCLDNGWGTATDPAAAAEQYRRAADAGHAWAQYNLGHLYLDGRGVPRDAVRAYAYYLRAAEQRHERAMNLAGRCCEEGWGRPRDLDAAAVWYERSAEAGYFRGQYNWASMLLNRGRAAEAAAWFERAVAGGPPAMRRAVMDTLVRAGAEDDAEVGAASAEHAANQALRDLSARLRAQSAG